MWKLPAIKSCSGVRFRSESVEAEGLAEPRVYITQHPGFHAVCLNRWVLQTAWYQYKQQYHKAYEGPPHKQNRHIAYRQLARWCWYFGKGSSSCSSVVCGLLYSSAFPSPGIEDDFVFKGFRFPDE